jgi:hypothetical protein
MLAIRALCPKTMLCTSKVIVCLVYMDWLLSLSVDRAGLFMFVVWVPECE